MIEEITVIAPAKINLSLDVTGRRPDGYHLISTVMQSIDLADRVTINLGESKSGPGIKLSCSMANLPVDRRNTAFKAATAFSQAARLSRPILLHIEKHIPVAAGLAGGSTDAAAVLYGLAKLCPGLLTPAQIYTLAAGIGADVPFCLAGGTALCEGIGDILTPLEPFDQVPVLLLKPGFGLSTSWSYAQIDQAEPVARPSQDRVRAALARRNLEELAESTANVLELVAFAAHPVLAEFKKELLAAGAGAALMSGSGPTLYGLFADEGSRDSGFSRLAAKMPAGVQLFRARTLAIGPHSGVN